jgi:hypothetical protein
MEVELQKGHRRMNTIVVRICIPEIADPGEERLIKMGLEVSKTVLKDSIGIALVESFEQSDDELLLFRREQRNRTALLNLSA